MRAAYNRAERMVERKKMMQAWADYLDGLKADSSRVLKLLAGQSALKMDVTSFPLNEEIAKAQVALQSSMTEAFAGRGAFNVLVKNDGAAG